MTLSRRRFLTIVGCAAGLAIPAAAQTRWRGRALGAEATISLTGGRDGEAALMAAVDTIRRMERLFSLHDPDSALSRLNRDGVLDMPPEFQRLVDIADEAHAATDGRFDPSIQPLFDAYATHNGRPDAALLHDVRRRVSWHRVAVEGRRLTFPADGAALTFNGIAQGFATDRVTAVLAAHGFTQAVVNIGEYRAGGAPARLAVADARGRQFADLVLQNSAVATSSPSGLRFADGSGHILDPTGDRRRPRWRTVSVEAEMAAIADAVSTALVLAPDAGLAGRLRADGIVRRVLLQDRDGKVRSI